MDLLIEYLSASREHELGTVVLAKLAPRRLILVEGDPAAAAELSRRAGSLQGVQVVASSLSPHGGKQRWLQHNVGALNGPLDMEPLRPYYPRLRVMGESRQGSITMLELLDSLGLTERTAQTNVLALDLPGQEEALLSSLPPRRLAQFDTVLLRGCREPLPGGATADAAQRRLHKQCFNKLAVDEVTEPLWPTATFQFDAARFRAQRLERQLAEVQATLQAEQARSAERDAAHLTLQAQAEQATQLASTQQQQIDQQRSTVAALQSRLAVSDEALRQARQAAETAAQQHAATLSEWQSRAAALNEERGQFEAGLKQTQAELASLKAEAAALQTRLDQRTEELQQQAHALADALARQERASAERQAATEALTRAKATADAAIDRQSQQLDKVVVERDDLARQARSWQAQAAQAQEALDHQGRQCAECQSVLDDERVRAAELEQQLRMLESERKRLAQRQQLLQDEVHRAEGQLEMIKDLLLGDAGL
jgi:chromosome segregation ATPase